MDPPWRPGPTQPDSYRRARAEGINCIDVSISPECPIDPLSASVIALIFCATPGRSQYVYAMTTLLKASPKPVLVIPLITIPAPAQARATMIIFWPPEIRQSLYRLINNQNSSIKCKPMFLKNRYPSTADSFASFQMRKPYRIWHQFFLFHEQIGKP